MPNSSAAAVVGSAPANDDIGPSIVVNTKVPFPPPKTEKPRPHMCNTCQRSFARLEHLKRHERSHTKEKPFECPECTRCFARRDLLLRHQQKLHQSTTPPSRPRNRRESTSSLAAGQSRARKNSMAAAAGSASAAAAAAAAAASASMRPRANTISHIDGSALQMMNAAAASAVARGLPAAHSRHPSLAGLPLHGHGHGHGHHNHGLDHHHPHHHMHQHQHQHHQHPAHAYASMSSAMSQRGAAHGLPKLETHGIANLDFSGGLRTAPPLAVFSPDFDFDSVVFGQGPGSTINPNALHYSGSPQSMALDPSPFSRGLHDLSAAHHLDDGFDWLHGFDHQMSFAGPHDTAVDGSSPSALSSASQSGISDVMLDGSNHPAVTSAAAAAAAAAVASATTSSMWPPSMMGPPQMAAAVNPFSLDLGTPTGFTDLLNGAPVSPQPPPAAAQKSMADTYFSTPPPSLSALSPAVMSAMTPQNLSHTLNLGPGPETPTSMNGSNHGTTTTITTPVSTITDSTRNAILGALASAALPSSSSSAPFAGRKYATSPPAAALGQQVAGNAGATADQLVQLVPSILDLQRYVSAYLRYFHPHMPFLHVATLSFEMPSQPAGGSGCLILAMAAIGALYELEHEQSMTLFELAKKMIQIYLDDRRKTSVRKTDFRRPSAADQRKKDDSVDTPVWLVQAMLLNIIYGHNCADRRAGLIASTHCTALKSLAEGAGLLRPKRVDADDDEDQDVMMTDGDLIGAGGAGGAGGAWGDDAKTRAKKEQAQWLKWKTVEEEKRTLYAVFVLSSLLVSAYNHPPALPNTEVLLDLPCNEELFDAPTSAAFHAKGGLAAASHNRMTFHDALRYLFKSSGKQQQQQQQQQQPQKAGSDDGGRPPPFGSIVNPADIPKSELKPSTFGCLILINALHNYIWETRERHGGRVWTNADTEKMHMQIEPALKEWQAAWASNPRHSLHRPNPFGIGPLSADAIPLLDLAYVRLFVNLASSKEKFWDRDWDGLADELSRGDEIVQHAEHSSPAASSNAGSNTTAATDPSSDTSAATAGSSSTGAGAFVDSPPIAATATTNGQPSSSPEFAAAKFPPPPGAAASSQMSPSSRSISRREKHLRKAAFYAADSLSMSGKLGVTFADFTSRELPLQAAMCAFDCAQVLAEWVATLQDRIGSYLGVLGRDEIDLTQVPAIMLLEDEDVKLLGKVQEVLTDAEVKINIDLVNCISTSALCLQLGENVGYAAKILRVTAYMLSKAAVWPVTHVMAECLERHACIMNARADKSVIGSE